MQSSEFSDKQISILEAAEELFAVKGFKGTSVRDIAQKAKINLSMISYYFGSKDKLLEAVFTYRGEKSLLGLKQITEKSDVSAIEKINLIIDSYIEKVFSQQHYQRIFAREQVMSNSKKITELILQIKKNNQALIGRLVKEGQENGEFIHSIDIPLMMTTLIGTATHMVTTKYFYKELSNSGHLPDDVFQQQIKEKLSRHLKSLIKLMLTHEA